MASAIENEIQINLIKQDLAKKRKPSELTTLQRRELFDAIFTEGAALHYQSSIVAIGDLVYGSGNPNINGGGFFFGEVLSIPVTTDANVNFKIAF